MPEHKRERTNTCTNQFACFKPSGVCYIERIGNIRIGGRGVLAGSSCFLREQRGV